MEDTEQNRNTTEEESGDGDVNFSHVQNVASGWMFDFMFVSLCRHFRDGKLEQFKELITTFEHLSVSSFLQGKLHKEKTLICALMARVLHGMHLDVLFEEDDSVMPLMSAFKLWLNLEETVADESLFKNIKILLTVQAVAVCLKKGQKTSASSVLKWFENQHECPKSVKTKLSGIVAQRETYNPFLVSFSYNRLLETTQCFLDAFLEKNPSDYLLKEATKMVKSSLDMECSEDRLSQDSSSTDQQQSPELSKKTKRTLYSNKITDLWQPVTCKKLSISVKRLHKSQLPKRTSDKLDDSSILQKKRKPRVKWTRAHDQNLEAGVKRHGVGKWGRILLDYDFEGRTGTMLKDRWRILAKANEISSEENP